jgi:hypothetical protein
VTLLAVRGIRRLDLVFFTHYGDLVSGLVMAVIGMCVVFMGI